MPYCSRDATMHNALVSALQSKCSMRGHGISAVYCPDSGIIGGWEFCVRPLAGVMTCSQLFAGVVRRLPLETSFLWLEPDTVPTRPTAIDELEAEFELARQENPLLCMMGHDKRDQWERLAFISGVAVYRTTPDLLAAVDRIPLAGCHDQELGRIMIDTQCARDTKLIRCVVGYERQEYLRFFERDRNRVLNHYRKSAAMIHGVKDSEFLAEAISCW